ncbi:hypothetical protein FCV25MIE_27860 [Fagus crenata]
MAKVSVITNTLKAVFLVRTAEPWCEPSIPMKPPGMVIPAAKVTVAMSPSTTKWALDVFCIIEAKLALSNSHGRLALFNFRVVTMEFNFFFNSMISSMNDRRNGRFPERVLSISPSCAPCRIVIIST